MPVYYDQLGKAVNLISDPKRIISLVPSQTELLFDLGLENNIIGITKFCTHPKKKVKHLAKVGGTKSLSIKKIRNLNPDIIIANKEENDQNQIEELQKSFPVWTSDIGNLQDALDMILNLGKVTNKVREADRIVHDITLTFNSLNSISLNLRVAYFIWRKPYMVAGKGTFINDILQKSGLTNVFELERYPEIYAGTLVEAMPDVVFLSSEPYPFKERHIDEFKLLLPNSIIKIVDGEMFSWYGSRLLQTPNYLQQIIRELIEK